MPIQPKCKKCKRLGGYTSKVESGLCQRCLNKKGSKRGKDGKFK